MAKEMMKLRPDLPIILCTGYSELVTPEKAKEAGIREYVMKPLSISELTGAIRRALGTESAAIKG
jgi:DNA-binding NtrC family response regulator